MRADTLKILSCPYCGGGLEVVTSSFHRVDGNDIVDAILGCHCCVFPVVAGIPIMHLEPAAVAARERLESGDAAGAARKMFGFDDAERAKRFEERAQSPAASYRELVDTLGPAFEGGYFLFRFSDPTYIVADGVVRGVAATAVRPGARAIDVCGGSGHLTRSLLDFTERPLVADLSFAKLWLARRFTAPGCEAVCCDGNAPLPFVRYAFDLVVCSDAFHYIWTKRLLASEMMRIATADGAVVVTHAHNANEWNPSAGMPLPPAAYRDLFAEMNARLFAERELLGELIAGGLDLSRRHSADVLENEPALTIIASRRAEVFRAAPVANAKRVRGELRVNPLYAVDTDGDRATLRLRFPSEDYEQEYAAARTYLADGVVVETRILASLPAAHLSPELADLARRRLILDLPKHYC